MLDGLTGMPGSFFRDFKRFQRTAPCEHPIVAVPAGVNALKQPLGTRS
jgi:hypothetical protein